MTTAIDVLGAAIRGGRLSAQIPDVHIDLALATGTAPTPNLPVLTDDFWTVANDLIQKGLLAWKVASPKPGQDKVLYTSEARNPTTKRLVNAYLWMTPLAVAQYGPQLHALYDLACDEREKKWAGSGQNQDFDTFRRALLKDTVPVAPAFSSQVPPDIQALLAPNPAAPAKAYGKRGPDGFVERVSLRSFHTLERGPEQGAAFLDRLDKAHIGPSTLFGQDGERGAAGADSIVGLAIARAGVAGVDWLINKGFAPETGWYQIALNYHGSNCISIWDHLVAQGADPCGATSQGTLWHSVLYNLPGGDATSIFDWLRAHKVDWHTPNPGGELPAAKVLWKISSNLGQRDFYSATSGGKMLAGLINFMPGAAQDAQREKAEGKALEQLLMDMLADGVDLTQKDKSGCSALNSIWPEQGGAERYLAQTGGGHLFQCDREALRRAPGAYGPAQLAFIRRLEKASSLTLLDDPNAPKPKKAKP